MHHYSADHPLRRYFSGLAEHTFVEDLGVADPPLIDYLSELLSRFISMDAIHRFQAFGSSLEQVADMFSKRERCRPKGAPIARCIATLAISPCFGRASIPKHCAA